MLLQYEEFLLNEFHGSEEEFAVDMVSTIRFLPSDLLTIKDSINSSSTNFVMLYWRVLRVRKDFFSLGDKLLQSDPSFPPDFRFDSYPVMSEEGYKHDLKSRPPRHDSWR